mmetsp:Transcript_59364/g.109785  ORF Transcript_59364/g.109785 Transcript_59364/m.109785 type:complete len:220 (-) Transcript_59364:230-889(-)
MHSRILQDGLTCVTNLEVWAMDAPESHTEDANVASLLAQAALAEWVKSMPTPDLHTLLGQVWHFLALYVSDIGLCVLPLERLATTLLPLASMIVLSALHRIAATRLLNRSSAMGTKTTSLSFPLLVLHKLIVPGYACQQGLLSLVHFSSLFLQAKVLLSATRGPLQPLFAQWLHTSAVCVVVVGCLTALGAEWLRTTTKTSKASPSVLLEHRRIRTSAF